jgi:hypothetical protein
VSLLKWKSVALMNIHLEIRQRGTFLPTLRHGVVVYFWPAGLVLSPSLFPIYFQQSVRVYRRQLRSCDMHWPFIMRVYTALLTIAGSDGRVGYGASLRR